MSPARTLFTGGRVRGAIEVETARTERALIDYEQTVLVALEETENAMVAYAEEQDRSRSLAGAVAAADRSVELFRTLYELELTEFQNVLDVQRSLTVQQDQLAESQGAIVRNLILLYRALGGGWEAGQQTAEAAEGEGAPAGSEAQG